MTGLPTLDAERSTLLLCQHPGQTTSNVLQTKRTPISFAIVMLAQAMRQAQADVAERQLRADARA